MNTEASLQEIRSGKRQRRRAIPHGLFDETTPFIDWIQKAEAKFDATGPLIITYEAEELDTQEKMRQPKTLKQKCKSSRSVHLAIFATSYSSPMRTS